MEHYRTQDMHSKLLLSSPFGSAKHDKKGPVDGLASPFREDRRVAANLHPANSSTVLKIRDMQKGARADSATVKTTTQLPGCQILLVDEGVT
eukprot:229736-Pelagomonas_calceolata.AAC.1